MFWRFTFFVCCASISGAVRAHGRALESCEDDTNFSSGVTDCSNCGGAGFCQKMAKRRRFCRRRFRDEETNAKKKGSEWCPGTCDLDCATARPTPIPVQSCLDRTGSHFRHQGKWYTCATLPPKVNALKKLCRMTKHWKAIAAGGYKGNKAVREVCPETCGYACSTFQPSVTPSQTPTTAATVKPAGPVPPTVPPAPTPPATPSPVSATTAVVTLGAAGVDAVVPAGVCPGTAAEELQINGSAYTATIAAGSPVTLLMYQCPSGIGFNPLNIKLVGFPEGLWFEIKRAGPKINLFIKSLTDYSEYFWGAGYSGDYPFQVAHGHYPPFAWDTVPKWISYRKKPNRDDSKFTKEEITSIATTNAMSWYGLVTVDEIVEVAEALKVANPEYKQLLYWNSFAYWGAPISSFNEGWLKYKVVGGKRWYLTMVDNKYVYLKDTTNKRRYYNHALPAMRQWWINHVIMMTSKPSIDGVFCDATRSNMGTDHSNMIEKLMNTLPSTVIKMGNFLRQRDSYRFSDDGTPLPHNGNRWRMPYADGSYLENVHDGPANQPEGQGLIASMQLSREALWKGKIIFWNGAPYNCLDDCQVTEEEMAEYIKPTLAEYLIIAERYSFYNFAVTPVATDNPAWMWNTGHMDEFKRPLGAPLGPPVKVENKFTRHFEHVSVMLTVGDDGVNYGTYVGDGWS